MTSTLRRNLIIIITSLQILFFVGWYITEARIFTKPIAQIMVKTFLLQQGDLITGQYLHLRYDFTNSSDIWESLLDNKRSKEVWVLLREIDGFYKMNTFFLKKPDNIPPGNIIIKGNRAGYGSVEFGIEKYFAPEETKKLLKGALLTVKLNIYKNGEARIAQVYLNNQPWP